MPEEVSGKPGHTFVFLEDVVKENIGILFPGAAVKSAHLFRIVRDTDMVIQEDEADDLLESVDRSLKELRYGDLSQLITESSMPARVISILLENFEVSDDVLVETPERMSFGDWAALTRLHLPQLKDPPFSPRHQWSDDDLDTIFDQIKSRDYWGTPPVRFVLVGRGLPGCRSGRSQRDRNQDHVVSNRIQLTADRHAGPSSRGR